MHPVHVTSVAGRGGKEGRRAQRQEDQMKTREMIGKQLSKKRRGEQKKEV